MTNGKISFPTSLIRNETEQTIVSAHPEHIVLLNDKPHIHSRMYLFNRNHLIPGIQTYINQSVITSHPDTPFTVRSQTLDSFLQLLPVRSLIILKRFYPVRHQVDIKGPAFCSDPQMPVFILLQIIDIIIFDKEIGRS